MLVWLPDMRTLATIIFICLIAQPAASLSAEKGLVVKGARYFSYAAFTRIVIELEAAAPYVLTKTADGKSLMLAAYEGPLSAASKLPAINDGVVKGLELRQEEGRSTVLIHLDTSAGEVKDFVLRSPDRIVLDVTRGVVAQKPPPSPVAQKTVIVIDPGHGGKDSGIITSRGLEKTRTLELALAVRKLLHKRDPNLSVVLTREKDAFLSLEERAASANAAGALLFVSIHEAPGMDTRVYILELDEGAAVQAPARPTDFLGYDAASEQQELLWGTQQAGHAKESGGLGRKIARTLGGKSGGEPVQAPMALLKAVDAAAVMVELGAGEDRSKATEALVKGIEQHVRENR